MAYLAKNIGDDLMLLELAKRNPDISFIVAALNQNNNVAFRAIPNIHPFAKSSSKICTILNSNGLVIIGGSMFMDKKGKGFQSWLGHRKLNIKLLLVALAMRLLRRRVVIIGCNIGPIETRLGRLIFNSLFKISTSISVRDQESYDYLKKVKESNVIVAPDIVFSSSYTGETKSASNKASNIGISVISLTDKELQKTYVSQTKRLIAHLANIFPEDQIVLFGFQADRDGDDKVIDEVMDMLPEVKNLKKASYTGNVPHFIDEISNCKHFVCTRFHSMVLAIKLNIPFSVISYSTKLDNVLSDLQYEQNIYRCGSVGIYEIEQIVGNISAAKLFNPYTENSIEHLDSARL